MDDGVRRRELAAFLASRRARVRPADVGLPDGGRRRVEGLRREEVAVLADVAVSWYTWLEQGRDVRPSPAVLGSIARALRLDAIECRHLFALAEAVDPDADPTGTMRDLDGLLAAYDCPAYAVDRRWTLLARNAHAVRLLGPLAPASDGRPNLIRSAFTDPSFRARIVDWQAEASRHVALLRSAFAAHLDDPAWVSLVEELRSTSPEFAAIWERGDVAAPEQRRKSYRLAAGTATMESSTLVLAGAPEVSIIVQRPADPASAEVLAAEP